jgi:DNA-binding CsgD family transcriptional regulator
VGVALAGAPRVLGLTTSDLDEYVFEALKAGASGFLLKDAPADQLVAGIRVVAPGDALLAPPVTRRLIEEFARRPTPPPEGPVELTAREREILTLIARGLTNSEIAGHLVLGESTVKTHVGNILTKLALRGRLYIRSAPRRIRRPCGSNQAEWVSSNSRLAVVPPCLPACCSQIASSAVVASWIGRPLPPGELDASSQRRRDARREHRETFVQCAPREHDYRRPRLVIASPRGSRERRDDLRCARVRGRMPALRSGGQSPRRDPAGLASGRRYRRQVRWALSLASGCG